MTNRRFIRVKTRHPSIGMPVIKNYTIAAVVVGSITTLTAAASRGLLQRQGMGDPWGRRRPHLRCGRRSGSLRQRDSHVQR
jgi:hypothetical protein